MSDTCLIAATTLGRIGDLVDDRAGVALRDLPPLTTLLVRTVNSRYCVVLAEWPEVYIHGGAFFPAPTQARINGARLGDSALCVGWIGVDLRVEILWSGQVILTSPVRAISVAGTAPAASCTGPSARGRVGLGDGATPCGRA